MSKPRGKPAQKVKNEISQMSQAVLNIVSKNIEKPHIAKKMPETTVQKHERDKG